MTRLNTVDSIVQWSRMEQLNRNFHSILIIFWIFFLYFLKYLKYGYKISYTYFDLLLIMCCVKTKGIMSLKYLKHVLKFHWHKFLIIGEGRGFSYLHTGFWITVFINSYVYTGHMYPVNEFKISGQFFRTIFSDTPHPYPPPTLTPIAHPRLLGYGDF